MPAAEVQWLPLWAAEVEVARSVREDDAVVVASGGPSTQQPRPVHHALGLKPDPSRANSPTSRDVGRSAVKWLPAPAGAGTRPGSYPAVSGGAAPVRGRVPPLSAPGQRSWRRTRTQSSFSLSLGPSSSAVSSTPSLRARSTSSAAQSRIAGSSPTGATLRPDELDDGSDTRLDETESEEVVVTVVILSGPRHSIADPQITPGYRRRRTVLKSELCVPPN